MEVAGLSSERGTRSSTSHRPAGARDRRRSHTAVRVESTRAGQGPSRAASAVERTAGARVAPDPDTPDALQADYFLRLLAGRRGLIDQRIDECQRKIVTAEAKGDADAGANFRHLLRIAEQDRLTVDTLIDKLRRRFTARVPGDAPAASVLAVRRTGPTTR